MLLWFLWLRKGRVGTLSSGLKAFDTLNKPVKTSSLLWPVFFTVFILDVAATVQIYQATKKRAQDSKAARLPDSPQRADEAGTTQTGDVDEGGAKDRETREGYAADQRAAENDDSASESDKA